MIDDWLYGVYNATSKIFKLNFFLNETFVLISDCAYEGEKIRNEYWCKQPIREKFSESQLNVKIDCKIMRLIPKLDMNIKLGILYIYFINLCTLCTCELVFVFYMLTHYK